MHSPLNRVVGVRATAGDIGYIGTGQLNAEGNAAMDWHPIQLGVEILLVVSCYRNRGYSVGPGMMGHLARLQTLSSLSWN